MPSGVMSLAQIGPVPAPNINTQTSNLSEKPSSFFFIPQLKKKSESDQNKGYNFQCKEEVFWGNIPHLRRDLFRWFLREDHLSVGPGRGLILNPGFPYASCLLAHVAEARHRPAKSRIPYRVGQKSGHSAPGSGGPNSGYPGSSG